MRAIFLSFLVVAFAAPAGAVHGGRVRVDVRGGHGRGGGDRTRIDVRDGHDRTKIDVRGERVRIDVRERGGPRHEARMRAWMRLRGRFGPRFVVIPAPLRLELFVNARRIAWLRRIRIVAVGRGDAVAVTRVDGLLVREGARHDLRVDAIARADVTLR
jgi:hypothetical protein